MKNRKISWVFFFVLFLANIFFISVASAAEVAISWDKGLSTNVVGFKVFYNQQNSKEVICIDVGFVDEAILTGLAPGKTYYIRAVAYDKYGQESDPTEPITYSVPASIEEVL